MNEICEKREDGRIFKSAGSPLSSVFELRDGIFIDCPEETHSDQARPIFSEESHRSGVIFQTPVEVR